MTIRAKELILTVKPLEQPLCLVSAGAIDRFVGATRKVGSGCIEWQAIRDRDGYGRVSIAGRQQFAHRVSFATFVGPIPAGLFVLHRCDNPPCVNPTHLFLGTNADNMADQVAKGRSLRGEAHGRTKLTAEQVREIRSRVAAGKKKKLVAAEFGIGHTHLWMILLGTTRPDVPLNHLTRPDPPRAGRS